jgi:hypothetical protein
MSQKIERIFQDSEWIFGKKFGYEELFFVSSRLFPNKDRRLLQEIVREVMNRPNGN